MHYLKLSIAPIILILVATLQVNAQVVKTPDSDAQVVVNSSMPHRGLSKIEVESNFGEPSSRQEPVGEPAIYRWDYGSYSVFFENNFVIHSVKH